MNDDPLGEIPPEHPWFLAIIEMVQGLKSETYESLVAPPGPAITASSREFDAGRCTMADDVLTRLMKRYKAAEKKRAG